MSDKIPLPELEYEIHISKSSILIELTRPLDMSSPPDSSFQILEVAGILSDIKSTLVDKVYRRMTH